jgi:hypothetical protein
LQAAVAVLKPVVVVVLLLVLLVAAVLAHLAFLLVDWQQLELKKLLNKVLLKMLHHVWVCFQHLYLCNPHSILNSSSHLNPKEQKNTHLLSPPHIHANTNTTNSLFSSSMYV